MPSVYGDVFERYRQLYGPPPVTDPEDMFAAGEAADEISEMDLGILRSRNMLEDLDGSIL